MKVDKYICENDDGNIEELKTNQLLDLIAEDKVSNAHTILSDDQNLIIWTDDDIEEEKQAVKYTIEEKIFSEDKIVGFKVKDTTTDKILKLSQGKVWELAANGLVDNCEARINNGVKIILI